MKKPHDLWTSLLPDGRSGAISRQRRNHCLEVLKLLAQVHPALWSGELNDPISNEEINSIVNQLHSNTPDHTFVQKIRYFARGIEKGQNDYGWDVPLPAIPSISCREPNKFTPESFIHLSLGRKLEQLFLDHLLDIPQSRTNWFGQIFFSAIVYGGLADKRWHKPLIKSIQELPPNRELIWLDLNLPLKGEDEAYLTRRWFLDPLTRALIFRHLHTTQNDSSPQTRGLSPQVCLVEYLQYIAPKELKKSISLHSVMEAAHVLLSLKLPAFLSSYASRKVLSVSLPTRVLVRLLTDKAIKSKKAEIAASLNRERKTLSCENVTEISPKHQDTLFNQLLSEFPPKRSGKALNYQVKQKFLLFHEEHKQELPPLLVQLLEWGIDLLTVHKKENLLPGRKKGRLNTTTVYEYLTAIGRRLIAVAGEFDLRELDSAELEEVYLAVKDLCISSKNKRKCGQFLYQFHHFLMDVHKVPNIDFSDITEGGVSAEATVNANLITFREYERILSVLATDFEKASRARKMQYLIFVIAFRCGLRRTEILKLRIIDAHWLKEPTLLIRVNRFASIKSGRAKRFSPLNALMSKEELEYLSAWRKMRFQEDGRRIDKNSLLFCEFGQNMKLVPDSVVSPVIQAIRQVTGDHTLQLKHLRHSFATWLTLRLLKDFDSETRSRYKFLDHPAFDAESCRQLRLALLGQDQSRKKTLYFVAQLCGHSSPEVTLLHYNHLCDWLLGIELSQPRNQPTFNAQAIQALTGMNENQVYYRYQANHSWQISNFLSFDLLQECKQYNVRLVDPDLSPIPDQQADLTPLNINWRLIRSVLTGHYESNRSAKELAGLLAIEEQQIWRWLVAEKSLKTMRTAKGNLKHVEYRFRDTIEKVPFPQLFRSKKDKLFVDKFFRRLAKDNDSELVKMNVEHFVNHYAVRSKGTRFSQPEGFESYLKFLKLVGIKAEQIFIHFNHKKTTDSAKIKSFGSVTKACKIPKSNIQTLISTNPFSIWVQVKDEDNKPSQQRYGSFAFLFCMYLLAIGLDIRGNSEPTHYLHEDSSQ